MPMKKLLLTWVFVTTVMGSFSFVEAQTIIYQQPDSSTVINTSFSTIFGIGTGLSGVVESISVYAGNSTAVSGNATLSCYTDATYSTQCPGSEPLGIGRTITLSGGTYFSIPTSAGIIELPFLEATTTSALQLSASRYYRLSFSNGGSGTLSLYGTTTPNTCLSNCTGSPYMYVYAVDTAPNSFDTSSRIISLVTPQNGATSPTASVTFQFSWFNSGLELYTVSQVEISDITNGYQYAPVSSNAAVSGYGTTTQILSLTPNHLHLWRACLLNPQSNQKTCSPTRSLNVVGASASSSFPTLPTVDDSNATSTIEGSIWGFLNAYTILQQKLPFAYFFQVGDLLYELQSTSTSSFEPVVFDYGSLDISTTSKNALPEKWIAFSTSTVTEYIPSGVLDVWRILMQAVIWFSFIAYIYHSIGKLFTGSTNVV